MKMKSVSIDSAERIFLDGEELQNVKAYKLEHSADSEGSAELTVTMYVNVDQVCSESSKWSLSADEIASAARRCLKNELQVAGSITDKENQKSDLLRRFTVKGEVGREALKIVENKKLSRQEVATLITGIEMLTDTFE